MEGTTPDRLGSDPNLTSGQSRVNGHVSTKKSRQVLLSARLQKPPSHVVLIQPNDAGVDRLAAAPPSPIPNQAEKPSDVSSSRWMREISGLESQSSGCLPKLFVFPHKTDESKWPLLGEKHFYGRQDGKKTNKKKKGQPLTHDELSDRQKTMHWK